MSLCAGLRAGPRACPGLRPVSRLVHASPRLRCSIAAPPPFVRVRPWLFGALSRRIASPPCRAGSSASVLSSMCWAGKPRPLSWAAQTHSQCPVPLAGCWQRRWGLARRLLSLIDLLVLVVPWQRRRRCSLHRRPRQRPRSSCTRSPSGQELPRRLCRRCAAAMPAAVPVTDPGVGRPRLRQHRAPPHVLARPPGALMVRLVDVVIARATRTSAGSAASAPPLMTATQLAPSA